MVYFLVLVLCYTLLYYTNYTEEHCCPYYCSSFHRSKRLFACRAFPDYFFLFLPYFFYILVIRQYFALLCSHNLSVYCMLTLHQPKNLYLAYFQEVQDMVICTIYVIEVEIPIFL